MSQDRNWVWPAGALLFLLGVNAVWMGLDRTIPAWDDSYYVGNSLLTYDAFTNGGIPGLVRQFLFGMPGKPPLIATLPVPIYLAVGRDPRAAILVNFLFLAVILGGVYLLARSFGGWRAGFFAIAIAGTMPMIYGLSRRYLVECGLTALVTVALLILARWELRPAGWMAPALGLVCGLGVLMKSSFPIYVAAPLVWLAIRRWRDLAGGRPLAWFLIPACAVAGPWYAANAGGALRVALAAGSAETARLYQTGGLAETGRYLRGLMNCGPTLYFAALPVLALWALGRLTPEARRGIFFTMAAAAPLVFLTFSHYRDLRYAAPLFPVIAVGAALLMEAASTRVPVLALPLAGLLLAAGTVDMLAASFGIGSRPQRPGLGVSTSWFSYVGPPAREPSPYPGLLALLAAHSPVARPRLVLGSDTRYCNADTLGLAVLTGRVPFDIQTTAYQQPDGLRPLMESAHYFAFVQGAANSAFNTLGPISIMVAARDPRFRQIAIAKLPDGSYLHVMAVAPRETSSAGRAGTLVKGDMDLPACSVKFSDGIELVGFSLRPAPGGLEARYRWRCVRPMTRNYWSFGHVVDASGKVLGFLDHAILEDTPTSKWEAGDTAVEKITIPIADAASAVGARVGVFDKQSGDRLSIPSSSFPLADSGTAAVARVK